MRRLFWVVFGATVGVLVFRRLTRAVEAYTPEGVGRQLGGVADGLREMAHAVREGMHQREEELRLALGVDAGDLPAEAAQSLLEDPTGPRRRY